MVVKPEWARGQGSGQKSHYRCVFFFGSRKHLSCTQVLYLQAQRSRAKHFFVRPLETIPIDNCVFFDLETPQQQFFKPPRNLTNGNDVFVFASLEKSRRQILFVWIFFRGLIFWEGAKLSWTRHVPRNTQFSPRVRATPSATYAPVMHQRASPVKMIVVRKMALCCDHFSGRPVWGPATPCWILVATCDIMSVSCWAPFSSFSCGGPCWVSESYQGLTLLFLGRNDKVGSLLLSRQPRAAQARPTCSVPRIPRQIKKIRVRVKTSVCRGLRGSLLVSLTLFKKEA